MMTTFKRGNDIGIVFIFYDESWLVVMCKNEDSALYITKTAWQEVYCVEADAGVHTAGKCNNNTESRPIRGQGHELLTNQRPDRGPGMQVVPAIDAEVTPSLQCSLECGHWAVRADATSSMQSGGLSYKYSHTMCAWNIKSSYKTGNVWSWKEENRKRHLFSILPFSAWSVNRIIVI